VNVQTNGINNTAGINRYTITASDGTLSLIDTSIGVYLVLNAIWATH
jgi:hypothetical protein